MKLSQPKKRVWQNPFYCEAWVVFWRLCKIMSIMWLFERPPPSVIIYAPDAFDAQENAYEAIEEVMRNMVK